MERPSMERALSTDVVMDVVLSHLKVRDLLACRKVSKFWNKAASSVLRRRSTMIKNISKENILKELEECLKQSSDFPFAGLTFTQPWKLRSAGALRFFKNHGARFTSLSLGASSETRLQYIAPILNHLSRLSILEVGSPRVRSPDVELLYDAAARQKDDRIRNLPSLRILRISSELNEDILREVCTAASASLRIECPNTSYGTLRALKGVGKLEAVSVMNVDEGKHEKDHILRVDKLLSTESPALTKLDFRAGGCISQKGLVKLLISSQHTLKELRLVGLCPSQFSSECPVLAQLTGLILRIVDQSYEHVFQGSHGHKFPALETLKVVTTDDLYDSVGATNLSDGLFIVPSLKTIDIDGYYDKAGIEDLARSFPNVIEIRLNDHFDDCQWSWEEEDNQVDFGSFGAFKFLEKLKIWHSPVEPFTRSYINMDRFLTGIPITICENLRKNEQLNLADSVFNKLLRDSPSILQLKDLKELTVFVTPGHPVEELLEEPPFISMVSVWYALQMMPNLQVKFMYDYSWLSRRFNEEKRDRAVKAMKAAFKQVQPYAELETFYY